MKAELAGQPSTSSQREPDAPKESDQPTGSEPQKTIGRRPRPEE
jgi:hypothetical protein